jgi:nucleotide-binding universal stress UspA family protein
MSNTDEHYSGQPGVARGALDRDPVRAIVEQAEHHRSGIIVVGARSQSSGRFEASVPSEVIERSRCSVLVTSLEP